jgi:Ni,Fe-hydrogenase I small subunit
MRLVMRNSIVAAAIIVAAARCASWRCGGKAHDVLTLETVSVPDRVDQGAKVRIRFALRNVGPEALDVCVPAGVSTMIEDELGTRRPLTLYGLPTSAQCPSRLHLDANEVKEFSEEIRIENDASPGPKSINASLYVRLLTAPPCAESSADLRTTAKLAVLAVPEEQ